MQLLIEHIINELSGRKFLRTAAVGAGLAAAAFGAASSSGDDTIKTKTRVEQPSSTTNKVVGKSPGDFFEKEEYDIIKQAADRNNCTGDNFIILLAIRKAENGGPGKEFGIVHPKAWNTDLNTQAGWCASTIMRNRERYAKSDKSDDFITFLGNRYCPVGAKNDPTNLNKNWIKNVKYWVKKLS